MKVLRTILCLLVLLMAGLSWIEAGKPTPIKFTVPPNWPKPVYDFNTNPLTVEGFTLGRALFYDPILSIDSGISCASCHQQFAAFATYDHNLSHGVNNQLTTRNAPSLQNLAWQKDFMWDGGINHLDLQPLAPLTAANEMGETISHVLQKLQQSKQYKTMFRAAFGDAAITTARMNKALSQFMLMLVSSNSKYDKVMRGEAAFILPEQLGYDIFKKKCNSCHTEPFFTDFSYRNTGLGVDNTLNDYGRMTITTFTADSLKFRVPSLRNVAITSPYGHDGRFFSLMSVFEHYRRNMLTTPGVDTLVQHRIALSNFEIGQLTAFLFTLTDTSFSKNPLFAPPGYNTTPDLLHIH